MAYERTGVVTGLSKKSASIHGAPSGTGKSVETVAPAEAAVPVVASMFSVGRSAATIDSDMAQAYSAP